MRSMAELLIEAQTEGIITPEERLKMQRFYFVWGDPTALPNCGWETEETK